MSSRQNRPILVMAGGTGGHVYPALAVARALQASSCEIVWLGTHRGLESRVVPAAGIDMEWISVKGLRRKGVLALVIAPLQLAWALLPSLAVIFRRRPAAVLGMGGFVSGPGGVTSNLSIVRAITSLAHALGMNVTAEGIESREHLTRVRAAGCDFGQGFLFSEALAGHAVETLLFDKQQDQ